MSEADIAPAVPRVDVRTRRDEKLTNVDVTIARGVVQCSHLTESKYVNLVTNQKMRLRSLKQMWGAGVALFVFRIHVRF